MKHLPFVLGLATALVLGHTPSAQQTVQIYASILDANGKAVTDLQPADFEVREGGVVRKVVNATLANEPMRVALLVDTSAEAESALNHFRAGLTSFVAAMPAETEIVLISIGRQLRVRVQPTSDRARLAQGINNLFTDGGATVLVDALRESHSRFLRKVENRWPVFVIMTTDGPDNSSTRDDEYERFIRELQAAGATGHAMILKTRGSGVAGQIGLNFRDYTGGLLEQIAVSNALGEQMKLFGDRIAAHARQIATTYKVSFVADGRDPKAAIELHVAREGVQVGLSLWRGTR
jgi:Mg-chelatase subunit ChlD